MILHVIRGHHGCGVTACRMQDELSARCTLEAGSVADVEGFGGFTIEGTHALGSDLGGNLDSAEVTAQGADSVRRPRACIGWRDPRRLSASTARGEFRTTNLARKQARADVWAWNC